MPESFTPSPSPSPTTTKEDVATLLENFATYVNPDRETDPWFLVSEINQQFAWGDIPEETLTKWLDEMVEEGKVTRVNMNDGPNYRWTLPE